MTEEDYIGFLSKYSPVLCDTNDRDKQDERGSNITVEWQNADNKCKAWAIIGTRDTQMCFIETNKWFYGEKANGIITKSDTVKNLTFQDLRIERELELEKLLNIKEKTFTQVLTWFNQL